MAIHSVQSSLAHVQSSQVNVRFAINQRGRSSQIIVKINRLGDDKEGYKFHIHEYPIKNGNCTTAGGHYDPTKKNPGGSSPTYNCKKGNFGTCEVGDLSGKFGVLKKNRKDYTFVDNTLPLLSKFNGAASIIIHKNDAKRTKIGCANIIKNPNPPRKTILDKLHLNNLLNLV